MTDLVRNAQHILETASAAHSQPESEDVAILVREDGAIRMVMGTDWSVDSLQRHHGATAYRVTRRAGRVRVEAKDRGGSCVLESETAAAIAKRLLADRPQYLLAN